MKQCDGGVGGSEGGGEGMERLMIRGSLLVMRSVAARWLHKTTHVYVYMNYTLYL